FVFRYSAKKDMLTIPMKNLLGQEQETVMERFLSTKRWADFVVPEDAERVETALSKILFLPNTGEIIFRYKKTPIGPEETYKVYFKNNASKSMRAQWVMGRIVNISSERESELEVEKTIKHDSITGFYNYRNFVDNVKAAMEQENVKKSSIIVLCINNLNVLNNTFGSMFADTVIQNVSRKLLTLVRESDICGRLNQDSFAIWIKNVESEIVYSKAKELCNSVSNVYSGERKNLNILSCAGISEGDREMSFEEMFQRAYSAMCYARKQENKCTATYRDNMPLVNMGSERFEKELYYRIENYDVDMLSFAFGLLVNSRDIASSINLLLARIGERYDLDDIVITSVDNASDSQTIINWWSKNYGVREATPLKTPVHKMMQDVTGRIDNKGMFIFNDAEYDEMSVTFRESGYHIKSMVGNAYYFDNRFAGFVGFVDEHNHRDWSDYVKGTFYEMVNILTVFLAINADKDADQKKINELSDIDRLTGLLNVDAFKIRAQQLADNLDSDDMLVMVFTDINNFAYINDTYGQTAGDSLLRDFGEYLSKRDNLSCRIYSDFFMTLGISKPGNLQYKHIKGANKKFEKMTKQKFPL
ncbi:MAG: diguanylate cyclase, partial [Lachnospiraceae bacterium]|nr:diguanylate cyclase [Lachnospiraceae bacterium]